MNEISSMIRTFFTRLPPKNVYLWSWVSCPHTSNALKKTNKVWEHKQITVVVNMLKHWINTSVKSTFGKWHMQQEYLRFVAQLMAQTMTICQSLPKCEILFTHKQNTKYTRTGIREKKNCRVLYTKSCRCRTHSSTEVINCPSTHTRLAATTPPKRFGSHTCVW